MRYMPRSAVAETVAVRPRLALVAVRVDCEGCRFATVEDRAMDGGALAVTARSITEWRKFSLFWTWGGGGMTRMVGGWMTQVKP